MRKIIGFFTALAFILCLTPGAYSYDFSTLDYPGSAFSWAAGINDAGVVTGGYNDGTKHHGYIFDGTFSTFDYPGAVSSFATDINLAGTIVGGYSDGTISHGYIYDGTFSTFDYPGGVSSFVGGINDAGIIVGQYIGGGRKHGYIYDGTFSTFDYPGAVSSWAGGINDSGKIVGGYSDGTTQHGYIYDGVTFTTFDYPGAGLSYAIGVNDSGTIVGGYHDGTKLHGYIATLPTEGLVAYYPFNGNANDQSNNDNDGTVNGATLTADRCGVPDSAYSFDGVDDYIGLGNDASLQQTGSITLSAWVKFNNIIPDKAIVSKHKGSPYRSYFLGTIPTSNHFRFIISSDGTSTSILDSNTTLVTETWYHVVGVFNASAQTMELYVNGSLDNSMSGGSVPTSVFNTSVNGAIGRHEGPGDYFDGLIDEVEIYNGALSTSEIEAIYDAGSAGKCKNQPPLADAGPDQAIHPGDLVTLNGGDSSDPDADYPLTYSWAVVSAPGAVTLSDPTAVSPTFTPNYMGDYELALTVTDSQGSSSAPDQVTISTENTKPVADAGSDQVVTLLGTTIQLNGMEPGNESLDPDGDPLTFSWSIITKPSLSAASLSLPASSSPTFVADVQGEYVAELIVSDPWVSSEPDTVLVSFNNIAPVANPGGNQNAVVGDQVFLNGADSTDANGDLLTYNWFMVSQPAGPAATLSDANTQQASFAADLSGTYVVGLTVNDGFVDSDQVNANVEVITQQTAITETLGETSYTVNEIVETIPESFKNTHLAGSLTNKINAALAMIDDGEYAAALDKLQNDILTKTDGCATGGSPDKNDWIKTCAEQTQIYDLIMEAISYLNSLL
jgi:hypothetical protein